MADKTSAFLCLFHLIVCFCRASNVTRPIAVINVCSRPCRCLLRKDDGLLVRVMDCTDARLMSIPSQVKWPRNLNSILLENNKIESVGSFQFRDDNLRELNLRRNRIGSLGPNSLENLSDLRELYLSHNELKRLDDESFGGLEVLMVLDLSFNKLATLPSNVMAELKMLQELRISYNPLRIIDPYVMVPLISLNIIKASNIGCGHLDERVFRRQYYLNAVDVSGNEFKTVPNVALKIRSEDNDTGLRFLDISDNPVKNLDAGSFAGLDKLLDVVVTDMPALQTIGRFTFGGMKDLQSVKIEGCLALKYIDRLAFRSRDGANNTGLLEVTIRKTGLTTIAETLVPWKQLQTIDLQENEWNCNCLLKWFDGISRRVPAERKRFWYCNEPERLRRKLVSELKADSYACDDLSADSPSPCFPHAHFIAIACVVALLLIIIVAIALRKRYARRSENGKSILFVRLGSDDDDCGVVYL